ncbi:DUF2786 domain-containing protein [Neisseria lactamica]|uniref:DUF2786 domain-containing protein n=1 Tax=Neisseria lactamica TaxID=486 RepID=UPI000E57E5EA|nr:DUF2786 domain-containing protein [Neisseria lactamica]
MNKEKVLDKIKKCLALSKSANEYEVAQALRQAQALMEKYEVNAVDIALSEVSEQKVDRKMAFKLANWQWRVANMIADVFGCQSYQRGKTMMFYGIGNRAEISAYAFDVVYRQISADRRKFLKTCRARKPAHRTYLADQFCDGWIMGAWEKVRKFEMSDEEKAIMDGYKKKEYPDMAEARTRDAKSSILQGSTMEYEALAQGMESGKQVQLHHAMNGTDGVKQIGEQK